MNAIIGPSAGANTVRPSLDRSPGSASPLSPSREGTPISFRKNVNRAKTKRWVEAKQYSYDGDDWGDDEYDEYDDNPPPVPQPPSLSHTNGGASGLSSKHSSRPSLADRSRSTDQAAAVGSYGPREDRSRSADGKDAQASHPPESKAQSFVRPADIYKRMQEEQAAQQVQSQDLGRPGEASQEVGQSAPDPASKTTSLPGHSGVADDDDRALHQPLDPTAEAKPASDAGSKALNGKSGDTPAPGLPEVKGLSNFSTDVLGEPAPSTSNTISTDSQRPPLQHSNSNGLQSAVHQAFDVPETPNSAVESSVSRSNSDSTSVVSPIIGGRAVSEQKTPTIVEEPGETGSTPAGSPRNVPFRPGHRRDLSLPGSENSASRKPEISDSGQYPQSANAEMSTDPSQDYFQLYRPTMDPSGSSRESPSHGSDLPAPLKPSGTVPAEQTGSKDSIPVIVPSMSSDNSPEDTESDRLRKEIIRSLSRENSPSDEPEGSRPQTGRADNLDPNQYESYRNDEAGRSAYEPPRPAPQPQASGPPKTFDDMFSDNPRSDPAPAAEQAPKPRLTRRFSWESSSSEELPPAGESQAPQTAAPLGQPLPASEGAGQRGSVFMASDSGVASDGDAAGGRSSIEKPKLTIIPPSAVDEQSNSERQLPEVFDGQVAQNAPASEDDGTTERALVPVSAPPPSNEPNLLGFRDILGIKSSSERVRSFNRTRDQFASIDTGLNHWIRVTVNTHPEHMDTVEESLKQAGSAPKQLVSKGKFPKLPSFGNLGSSGSTGSLHVRRPSGHMMNRQQVEQRGKDLLHSAGVLGGRAGGAAKGFFAKGKHKFNRGNGERADV